MFCIVGPTATGKSKLAAEIAIQLGGEIVNADAFQIYEGFDILSGKPETDILERVRHHLVGTVPATEEMSAAKYRMLALPIISEIQSRERLAIVVGGSGLYLKALTDGLAELPPGDARLRDQLQAMTLEELQSRLTELDPLADQTIDMKNRRRVVRAIEIAMISGRPASEQRRQWGKAGTGGSTTSAGGGCQGQGVLVFRDREELYQRINDRVKAMLDGGAIEEVRDAGEISLTVEQMIGVKDIRRHLSGEISRKDCVDRIQQLTRRYAKRQLTWFRHQTNLKSLNLSLLSHNEAVLRVARQAIGWAHGE